MYVYTFKVNGVTCLDPGNNIVVRDGSHIESRLMIPGKQNDLYDVKDVPHGRVTAVWYPAVTLGMNRRCLIYRFFRNLRALYDEIGFKYTYRESSGGHSWNNWRLYLAELAPMLF
jgi:enterochelin esterase-like enzyme